MTVAVTKAFISYSWSSPAHEQWVLDLATRLVEDGIDIKLDKWDLGIGQDKYVFMESMVTDPSVTKVIVICDRSYVEKANARKGGAGTEAQILTPELYKSADQSKFAAIIRENDVDGNAYVPAFFAGRIYIPFSDETTAEKSYEELLRWLLGKPLHVKPKLGTPPESITNPKMSAVGTTSSHKRACDAIREGRNTASGLTQEYADILIAELKALRPVDFDRPDFDDVVVASADAMRVYIRQFGELVLLVARYSSTAIDEVLAIEERIAQLMYRPAEVNRWHQAEADSYKIIAYESFLQLAAILLQERRYDFLARAIKRPYFVSDLDRGNGPKTRSFTLFAAHVPSLEHRKKRLELRWIDLQATMMSENQKGVWPSFEQIMQADFVMFLTASIRQGIEGRWYPRTLVYKEMSYSPFELFARSESLQFFKDWAPEIFGPISIDKFKKDLASLDNSTNQWYDYRGLAVNYLANSDYIGSKA